MATVERQACIQLNNILFATAFSPSGNSTAPYAADTTTPRFAPCTFGRWSLPLEKPGKACQEATVILAKARELVNAFPGLEPQILINDGDLWSNFQASIERYKIDLVVMGTRSRSGVSKLLLGSPPRRYFVRRAAGLDGRTTFANGAYKWQRV